jgi:hypothetical protein
MEGCKAAAEMMYAAVAINPMLLVMVANPNKIESSIRPQNGESKLSNLLSTDFFGDRFASPSIDLLSMGMVSDGV